MPKRKEICSELIKYNATQAFAEICTLLNLVKLAELVQLVVLSPSIKVRAADAFQVTGHEICWIW